MRLLVRSCSACGDSVRLHNAVRLRGRHYCGHECAAQVRASYVKAFHDLRDTSPTVCRCQGAPQPLEPQGPHCAACRRLFSAGVRVWLVTRSRKARRWRNEAVQVWVEELLAQLRLGRLRT